MNTNNKNVQIIPPTEGNGEKKPKEGDLSNWFDFDDKEEQDNE